MTNALNFLQSTNSDYKLNLNNVILIGFSAGAHIATNVGVSRNNREYPNQLDSEINIAGIINFSGPVDGLGVVEKIFSDSDIEMMSEIGKALFSSTAGHASKETIAVYEPITYFEKNDPPFFLWYGGNDNQILPETFEKFIPMLSESKDLVIYKPDGQHSPNEDELKNAYAKIFMFWIIYKNSMHLFAVLLSYIKLCEITMWVLRNLPQQALRYDN